jgi:hypothetical protein
MLLVQQYLQSHTLDELKAEYGIKNRRHGKYPNLVLLKYDQLNADFTQEIVGECRGLILDEVDNWKAICFPYRKFHNYGQLTLIPDIDWRHAEVQEKLDGSIMTLYNYKGEWQVSSSGVPNGDTPVEGYPFTFKDLFWKVWLELGYDIEIFSPCQVYMFELMTPYNQVVVKINKNRLVMHGVRHMDTLKEYDPRSISDFLGVDTPQTYPFTTLQEAIQATKAIKPEDGEGFVVCDANFNRLKIKSEEYVYASHLKESVGASMRNVIEAFQRNEVAEVLAYLPQYEGMFDEVADRYDTLLNNATHEYSMANGSSRDQKEFALLVKGFPFSGALFQYRAGKVSSIDEGLRKMSPDKLMQLLGFKLEDIIKYTIDNTPSE